MEQRVRWMVSACAAAPSREPACALMPQAGFLTACGMDSVPRRGKHEERQA